MLFGRLASDICCCITHETNSRTDDRSMKPLGSSDNDTESRAERALGHWWQIVGRRPQYEPMLTAILMPMHMAVDSPPFAVASETEGSASFLKVYANDIADSINLVAIAHASHQAAALKVAPQLLDLHRESGSLLYAMLSAPQWRMASRSDLDDPSIRASALAAKRDWRRSLRLQLSRSPFEIASEYRRMMSKLAAPGGGKGEVLRWGYEFQRISAWIDRIEQGLSAGGHDLMRCLVGLRYSLLIGSLSVAVMLIVGSTVGTVAGYFGGRLTDAQLSIPIIILSISVLGVLRPTIPAIILVLGLSNAPVYARIMRSIVMTEGQREYVRAATIGGSKDLRIILTPLVPLLLPAVLFISTLDLARMMIFESILRFLGLGVLIKTATTTRACLNALIFSPTTHRRALLSVASHWNPLHSISPGIWSMPSRLARAAAIGMRFRKSTPDGRELCRSEDTALRLGPGGSLAACYFASYDAPSSPLIINLDAAHHVG